MTNEQQFGKILTAQIAATGLTANQVKDETGLSSLHDMVHGRFGPGPVSFKKLVARFPKLKGTLTFKGKWTKDCGGPFARSKRTLTEKGRAMFDALDTSKKRPAASRKTIAVRVATRRPTVDADDVADLLHTGIALGASAHLPGVEKFIQALRTARAAGLTLDHVLAAVSTPEKA